MQQCAHEAKRTQASTAVRSRALLHSTTVRVQFRGQRGTFRGALTRQFASARVYRPAGAVRQVALLLSGDGGWSRDLGAIAYKLSGEGTLTAGIDLPPLFANLARDPASCVSPDADLADLARYLQDRYHLPHTAPLLIGHSAGATLAYTSIAQAPGGTFSGALTLSFCVELELQKPLCRTPALRYQPLPSGSVRLLPGPLGSRATRGLLRLAARLLVGKRIRLHATRLRRWGGAGGRGARGRLRRCRALLTGTGGHCGEEAMRTLVLAGDAAGHDVGSEHAGLVVERGIRLVIDVYGAAVEGEADERAAAA